MTGNVAEQQVPTGWTGLGRPSGDLLVACDFASAGRPIATFGDLVSLLPPGFTVWESAPPPYGEESGMDGAAHVDRWAGALRTARGAAGRPVRAVLGFCSGSVYAGMIADRIAGWQPRPRLVLLDPEPATPAMMLDFYRERVNRFASVLAPDEVAAALRAGEEAAAADMAAPALAARLRDLCRGIVAPACERVGLPDSRVTEFVGLAGAYLHWLAAAIDLPARWPTAHAVNCATPGIGLRSVPAADRDGLVASARYLDVSHTDLMRSPLTARAVADLLMS